MPLMTKQEIEGLAFRIRDLRRHMICHKDQTDLLLAGDALLAMKELVIVAWPIAIGD